MNIPEKNLLNIPLNWILPWNEWLNHILNRYFHFWWKAPFFVYFGHFSYSTSINDPLTFELNYLLNRISRVFLNWIIFWIESWVKRYWIKYRMNHFLAKFKHWTESEWVLATTSARSSLNMTGMMRMLIIVTIMVMIR